jgi:hypothetical protein
LGNEIEMDIEQVRLQYDRLNRHYQGELSKDPISFLDFSHTLRMWVDMKALIDLHNLIVADGYPATHYQLLEIGKDILQAMERLVQHSEIS